MRKLKEEKNRKILPKVFVTISEAKNAISFHHVKARVEIVLTRSEALSNEAIDPHSSAVYEYIFSNPVFHNP